MEAYRSLHELPAKRGVCVCVCVCVCVHIYTYIYVYIYKQLLKVSLKAELLLIAEKHEWINLAK